jgi:chromosome segregation ATPase
MTDAKILIACFWFAIAAAGFGQNPGSDSQTMREILTEIRGIHEDMRVTQTTQILLTEFEMQQSVVNRATEDVDSARTKLLEVQRDQKLVASDLQRAEDHLGEASDADEKKHIAEEIERHKSNIAAMTIEERGRTTTLQQMEQRLQTAQDTLEQIESELNAIVARLHPSGK